MVLRTARKRSVALFFILKHGTAKKWDDRLVKNAEIDQGPPIQVAWREVEDRRVGWLLPKKTVRLGETAHADNLYMARYQPRHQPAGQIGTVNKQ